jgi:membrane associated rhomboid family serine protease
MREASVGFQCPDCVAQGARTTRSGRTAYGGLRSGNPGLTSVVLIALNAAVWLLVIATGGNGSRLLDWLELRPNGLCLVPGRGGFEVPQASCSGHGTFLPGVADGAWWQLMTSAFTHVEILHIGFNMLALWFLGPQLEAAIGRTRFLALYLLSALAGSTAVYWLTPEYQATLGASGAVFGLMGALLVLALKVGANPQQLLLWIGINVVFTLTGANISWQGHLGGFIGGVLIAVILAWSPRVHRAVWQTAGMSAFGLALVVAIVVRTAVLT